MAQSFGSSIQEKAPRTWGSSDHITSRIAWPLNIFFGQVIILSLAVGFLAGVRARGQVPLGLDAAMFLQNNTIVQRYLFTFLANALSLFSSYLFAQAVRHAILVCLTRSMAISTLGNSIRISKKSVIFSRQYKWAALSVVVFALSLGQTPSWTSLITPDNILISVPLAGREFDLEQQPLNQNISNLWRDTQTATFQNYLTSSLLSIMTEAGAVAATSEVGYPALVNFAAYSHQTSTFGILPVNFYQDASLTNSALTTRNSTQLITTNLKPFPAAGVNTQFTVLQQGLTAVVGCQGRVLDETTTPAVTRSNAVVGNFFSRTLQTICPSGQPNTDIKVTNNANINTLMMVGCAGTDATGQANFQMILDGQGGFQGSSWVCEITPRIVDLVVSYNGNTILATQTSARTRPAGAIGVITASSVLAVFQQGQTTTRSMIGDSLLAVFTNQLTPDTSGEEFQILLNAYMRGIVEFSATASKTLLSIFDGPYKGNPPKNFLRDTNGTAQFSTLGWEYEQAGAAVVLLPILFFGLLTIAIALVAQFYNHGIPLSNAHFDPNDPWCLMAASAAGGMSRVFDGVDEEDVEKGWKKRVKMGEVNGKDGFVQV